MSRWGFAPLTPDRFDDLARLFETDSITRSCWCMMWRHRSSDFAAMTAGDRRSAFAARVADGPPPGLLAYHGDATMGWVQVTPRDELARFNRSRVARPTEGTAGVWAVSCFFVRKDARRTGLMTALAGAACAHAARAGARAVEAAALEPKRPMIWGEGFVGLASALSRAGFVPVERRSETRVLMRWTPSAGGK